MGTREAFPVESFFEGSMALDHAACTIGLFGMVFSQLLTCYLVVMKSGNKNYPRESVFACSVGQSLLPCSPWSAAHHSFYLSAMFAATGLYNILLLGFAHDTWRYIYFAFAFPAIITSLSKVFRVPMCNERVLDKRSFRAPAAAFGRLRRFAHLLGRRHDPRGLHRGEQPHS